MSNKINYELESKLSKVKFEHCKINHEYFRI
jgi:hypothetical protein